MNFFIKKTSNWISVDKDIAISTTPFPLGIKAIVKHEKLFFTRKDLLCVN
ncbi:hypothetical protein [Sulfurimonas sp.]|nr:hypothetical protein [Sulfurimonas sp.]